jgi:integrase/recombinase XerD
MDKESIGTHYRRRSVSESAPGQCSVQEGRSFRVRINTYKEHKSCYVASMVKDIAVIGSTYQLPAIVMAAGPRARKRILEFFGASIRNANTRAAYMRACGMFFDFLTANEVAALEDIEPLHVAAYLEALKAEKRSVATQKLHMSAVRMLLDYLVTGGIIAHNPALSVRAPRQSVSKGKTPTLSAEEAGRLLRSIKADTIIGLRDRALIGLMVFTFARISAAVGIDADDLFRQKNRLWVRLHEKGGKVHDMPTHFRLEEYLHAYVEAAGLPEVGTAPLFQSVKRRPYGRGPAELSGRRLSRVEAWQMVQRRGAAAGLDTHICNHTFRGTGITTYLENGGTLENAKSMAAHASVRTTQLYDRRRDEVTLEEVVKINIKG